MVVRPHKIFLGNLCIFKSVAKKVLESLSVYSFEAELFWTARARALRFSGPSPENDRSVGLKRQMIYRKISCSLDLLLLFHQGKSKAKSLAPKRFRIFPQVLTCPNSK
jgi:hypothetical protein